MRHTQTSRSKKACAHVGHDPSRHIAGTPNTSSYDSARLGAASGQRTEEYLACAASGKHDSGQKLAIDDWPLTVPITSDEVDVIEAFLRREIDALLR
ncbi:MAG TPA: hypothetical protein VIQ29_07085 [Ancylobacter sp.]